jgi:predicted nucleotidyltransferase
MADPTPSALLRAAADRYTALLEEELGPNLVSAVLFGSVARSEATAGSDIDLLVVCDALPDGRFARLATIGRADERFEKELNRLRAAGIDTRVVPILRPRAEARRVVPLYLDMVEDARLLRDRDGFFAGVLAGLRTRLTELGAERRRRGRSRYWVLKRDFRPGEVITL